MPADLPLGDFSNVDASNAAALIAYLDAVFQNSVEDKRKTYSAQQLARGMTVLDLGCGIGDDVRAIAEIVGPTGKVYGIDSSAAMIAEARGRGVPANVEFIAASAGSLPLRPASFDAARAERVFQHLADPDAAARELRRIVRPGGTAFLLDPDWETLMIGGTDAELVHRVMRAFATRFANPWAGRNARALLRRAGFQTVVATPIVSSPMLAAAYDLFLHSAIDTAIAAGVVDAEHAARWLHALLDSEKRGEFFCGVVSVAALATA